MIKGGGGGIIFCRILASPSPDTTILNYLNDRERGRHYLLQDFGAPQCPPPPQTPQYLKILMTKRGRYYLCKILTPPMPPSHDATVLNYLNDREREGAPLSFVGFWRPPSSPNATILNYLIDRERGRHYLLLDFSAPPLTPQYLTILMTERGGAIMFCRILSPPSPKRHNT